jgi:RNA polymerase sigma-70 factor (ECF subfamily)
MTDEGKRIELFVKLLGRHQHQIHRYLLALVPNHHDADDLFQETNLFLWREFHRFQEGTSFLSWACSVAYYEVLAWRKRASQQRLVFDVEFLAAVSSAMLADTERNEMRASALADCVQKLPVHQRKLLQMRYENQQSIEFIAANLNRTTEAVYRALSRVRHVLFDCINRMVEYEGR